MTENQANELNDPFIFEPLHKTWAQHVADTPEGYHLATRGEIISAMENRELDELVEADEFLWTASEYDQLPEMAWVVGYALEYSVMKSLEYPAVYIKTELKLN